MGDGLMRCQELGMGDVCWQVNKLSRPFAGGAGVHETYSLESPC